MNPRTLISILLLIVTPVIPVAAVPTIIVVDASFSMALSTDAGHSRLTTLLGALEQQLAEAGEDARFGLVSFDDARAIQTTLPYPATAEEVLAAARGLEPWGTSPVLNAIRYAADYAAGLGRDAASHRADLILLSDLEDDAAAVLRGSPMEAPAPLMDGTVRLSVITLGGDRPGATDIPVRWAAESGGSTTIVDANGRRAGASAFTPAQAGAHELSDAVSAVVPPIREDSHAHLVRVLSAWLLVLRWNLAAAAALGIVAFGRELTRWRRRAAAVRRHNATPTQVRLEVRTALRRNSHTFARFPVTVGTTPGCDLELRNGPATPHSTFELRLADEGLHFTSTGKLNVNGVPRTRWDLREGDQIRVGKYRIIFDHLITTTPLPLPDRTDLPAALISGLALVIATLLFLFTSYSRETADQSAPARPPVDTFVSPGEEADREEEPGNATVPELPPVYSYGEPIGYFDADYLVVHAHPDDESLDFGVLIARLSAAGLRGVVVLLTDGESGRDQYPRRETGGVYPAYDLTGAALARVRVQEARQAMGQLGVTAYVRGGLENFPYNSVTDELPVSDVLNRWGGLWSITDALAEVIAGFSPEIVISPDIPRGPYEHFEHEATGVIVATTLEALRTAGLSPVRAHLIGIDPLQTSSYDDLIAVSPWQTSPRDGVPYRVVQLRALAEHRTQRDSSVVGIETRLAVPAEYYAVGFWDPAFPPPAALGVDLDAAALSAISLPAGR